MNKYALSEALPEPTTNEHPELDDVTMKLIMEALLLQQFYP